MSRPETSFGPRPWIQQHWDARAAGNFVLGGAGAGLLIAAPLAGGGELVRALGLAMIAAGLTAVWLEIGRKLRAIHVFFNPWTSWMTRESFAALVVFGIGISTFVFPDNVLSIALAVAALLFLFCQARILFGSKGIPAWRAPEIVPLVMLTGLAEGAGIALLFGDAGVLVGLFVLALLSRALAWSRYRAALKQPRSAAVLEPAGRSLLQLGTVLPIALLLFSTVAPEALWLAGLMAAATGWRVKFTLVTRAAHNQGFTLPHLPIR